MIYVANPYSHKDPVVMLGRFKAAEEYVVRLIRLKDVVYSPIVHSHQLAIDYDLPVEYEMWKIQCQGMLKRATALHVLMLEGWKESVGVQDEINLARELKIPVFFMEAKAPYEY